MRNIFGADDDRLLENQIWMNDDDSNDKDDFTPCAMTVRCLITVRCSFLPSTYNVSRDVGLAFLTAAHVFEKVKKRDNSFELDTFDMGFYPGETKTLTILNPSALLSQHGFTDPTTMTLAIARKPRRTSKLKSRHRCRVKKCPGHSNEQGHVVCSNKGCEKLLTHKCYVTLLVILV
jgi:hypothetical protein